jgi:hypothetical protein
VADVAGAGLATLTAAGTVDGVRTLTALPDDAVLQDAVSMPDAVGVTNAAVTYRVSCWQVAPC